MLFQWPHLHKVIKHIKSNHCSTEQCLCSTLHSLNSFPGTQKPDLSTEKKLYHKVTPISPHIPQSCSNHKELRLPQRPSAIDNGISRTLFTELGINDTAAWSMHLLRHPNYPEIGFGIISHLYQASRILLQRLWIPIHSHPPQTFKQEMLHVVIVVTHPFNIIKVKSPNAHLLRLLSPRSSPADVAVLPIVFPTSFVIFAKCPAMNRNLP